MASLVNGVFYQLGSAKQSISEHSRKWCAVLLVLVAFTLALVATLVGLALRSYKGFGVVVVSGTFVTAGTVFLARVIASLWQKAKTLVRQGPIPFALLCGIAAIVAMLPISLVINRSEGLAMWSVIAGGGLVLSGMILLLIDGYPVFKQYKSPGYMVLGGVMIVLALVYMTWIAYWIVPYDPFEIEMGHPNTPPCAEFPMGTTSLGQDMLSRVIAGGATMLQVAVLSVIVCFCIGVPIGLLASYRGGAVDKVVSLVMDSIFAFPGLVLAIAIAAMLGPGVVNMAISIAVVYVPSYFRVVRSQVLTIRELAYVEAAIIMGARDRDILLRYVLPNVLPSSVVVMSINFADAILTAAGLTFVGLGLPVDIADWGWDLTYGFDVITLGYWWVPTFPGIMVVLLALGFTLTGEGLNEILTPKLQE